MKYFFQNSIKKLKTVFAIAGIGTSISIFVPSKATSLPMAIATLSFALFFLRWAGIFWSVPAAIAGLLLALAGSLINYEKKVGVA